VLQDAACVAMYIIETQTMLAGESSLQVCASLDSGFVFASRMWPALSDHGYQQFNCA